MPLIADTDHSTLQTLGDIVSTEATPKRKWWRGFETVAIVLSLLFGGFGTGFIYASRNNEVLQAQQREDHLAEIKRLTEAQRQQIGSLARTTERAAGEVEKAAEAASTAAKTATTAAGAAQGAAQKVERLTTQQQRRVP